MKRFSHCGHRGICPSLSLNIVSFTAESGNYDYALNVELTDTIIMPPSSLTTMPMHPPVRDEFNFMNGSDFSLNTPPPSHDNLPNVQSTPQHPKLLHNLGSLSGTLEDARSDVLRDIGPIPVVSFSDFSQHILPPITFQSANAGEDVVENLLAHCRTGTNGTGVLINGTREKSHWKHFAFGPIDTVAGKETAAFAPLVSLWDDIVGAAKDMHPGIEPMVCMVRRPFVSQSSEHPISTRPDGVIELIETSTVTNPVPTNVSRAPWEDTAAPMEYKKKDDWVDVRIPYLSILYSNPSLYVCTEWAKNQSELYPRLAKRSMPSLYFRNYHGKYDSEGLALFSCQSHGYSTY